MAKIYLSLPIDTNGYDVSTQMRIARKWQRYFEAEGHTVVNPFDVYDKLCRFKKDAGLKPPTRSEIMKEDIAELLFCNVIFLCNGWQNSKGCIEEAETATQFVKITVKFESEYDNH